MWSAKLLQWWLYSVHPTDAPSLVTAEAAVILVGIAECIAPALQASRSDPLEILRAA